MGQRELEEAQICFKCHLCPYLDDGEQQRDFVRVFAPPAKSVFALGF